MPGFRSHKLTVTVDMAGCPNRCRHCWLGNAPSRRVSEDTLRWVAGEFRRWVRQGEREPFARPFTVMTWYREPDFAADYRRLWELEKELSDEGAAARFELLSIWRLARDEGYARWAREIGTEACQISFFGLEENTDYFARRLGAFRDSLLATERLLDVGIRPRWQLFLTEPALADLSEFVSLAETLDLEPRVRRLGHEFELFLHLPGPDGEAFNIEHLRPTMDVLPAIPAYLAEKTVQYKRAKNLAECFGRPEGDWVAELVHDEEPFASYPDTLAFMVTPELDVYSNLAEPAPRWKLGNLRTEGIDEVMRRFECDGVPGLWANTHLPVSELARAYGRPHGKQIYNRDDLVIRWLRMWGEEHASSS